MRTKKIIKFKKQFCFTVVICMLFQITQAGFFSANKVSAATGFRHVATGTDVFLGGNYIEVGVTGHGSFGTANPAPTGFHPISGPGVGLRVDGDGFDTGNAPTTGDFFLPGTPEESFTVGYKVGSSSTPTLYTNAERMNENGIATVTTDVTADDTLSALTSGITTDNNLKIEQKISFKVDDKFFKNTVTYTNNGASTLYDVRYMRSFDPDQDANLNGAFKTYNCVLENFPEDSRAIVRAKGQVTGDAVFFISTDSRARAASFGFSNRNPYDLLAYNNDGGLLKSTEALIDGAIAITFDLGDLAPGQSTTFEYYTSLDPNYSAGLAAIMGSLGIQINNGDASTNSVNVTLKLSGDNVAQMRFSHDNSTWSDWETYNTTKAWSLTSGDGIKTVYAQFKDASGKTSTVSTSINYIIPDNTPPVFTVSGNPAVWTKDSVTLSVSASDGDSGLNTEGAYSFDNGLTWTTSNAKSFSDNGTFNIKVRDNDGNISSQSIVIDKIDKTLPVISSITGNPSDWTENSATLTVNASDAASGLAALPYSFDGGATWQSSNAVTYGANTNDIAVKVKDSVGNIAACDPINITKIDKTLPNAAVIENKDKYGEDKWFNETQTVSASFTATVGCDEKLQYKVDSAAWTDGEPIDVTAEGKHVVNFRVIDCLGRTSAEQAVVVNIDKTAPTSAKITVEDKEFTSFLNKITFGLFFKDTVNVTITGDSSISGISKIEYQKVSDPLDYNPNGTWTEGNSFSVSPDAKFVTYAKITDNAGNFVIINSDGVIVDATKPTVTLTPDAADWTKNDVKVNVKVSDSLSGIKEVNYATDEKIPQTGTAVITGGEGNITLTNEGQYKLTVTAKDNSLNEISETLNIKIDRTIPVISGADSASSYYIGRIIKVSDSLGEIASAVYKNGTGAETSFKDGGLFENAGMYTLNAADKAENSAMLSFEIKALPKVSDIVYTPGSKALIDSIRSEFNGHNDLPEPYKTDMDNEIKALEERYAFLDKEVADIKTETAAIQNKIEMLPNKEDGLISLKIEIQNEYNKIAEDTSTLTEEQKKALEEEAEYLQQLLNKITDLESQVSSIRTQVSSIDTKEDGLISQESKISGILSDISSLNLEQQKILQPEIDLLNGFIDKINTLKTQVETLKDMINALPAADKITKLDAGNINAINKLLSQLTDEQKQLLGKDLIKQLDDTVEVLKKLMLYDADTDTTVTGIDGTSFTTDVYLVVTPIDKDTNAAGFQAASDNVEDASKYVSAVKGKEILALYDVSLFRDGIKIQPDGKVKVKIKIPEGFRNRTGLDIIHIADNGIVTPMNAVVEGEYLVFITDHFSDYAIVAKTIAKEIPKTGSSIDFSVLSVIGAIFILGGLLVLTLRRKKI
jgi:LPXTG-motif cell wall-anchored protein